jgi:hypothetical protein
VSSPHFTSAWIPSPTLRQLTHLVAAREHLDGAIIEFGAWEGRSTIAIGSGTMQDVIAVDHWQGNLGDPWTEPHAQTQDIYARFTQNTAHLPNIIPAVMRIEDFMDSWDSPIKFLHIDADHNYHPVKEQIEWAKPLMVEGGIMCGDDYSHNWPGVVQAVNETLPEHRVEIVMWMQDF